MVHLTSVFIYFSLLHLVDFEILWQRYWFFLKPFSSAVQLTSALFRLSGDAKTILFCSKTETFAFYFALFYNIVIDRFSTIQGKVIIDAQSSCYTKPQCHLHYIPTVGWNNKVQAPTLGRKPLLPSVLNSDETDD